MSYFNLDNFRAEVLKKGLAKANRFEVVIQTPNCLLKLYPEKVTSIVKYNTVGMFAEFVNMPGVRFITSRQNLFGPPSFHPQTIDFGGDNLTIQFYLDRSMFVKSFFDNWMDCIISKSDFTLDYQNNWIGQNMQILQLDEQDNALYGVEIRDLFPVSVNPIQLDHNSNNTPTRLNVTFNYKKWEYANIMSANKLKEPPTKSVQEKDKIFNKPATIVPRRITRNTI